MKTSMLYSSAEVLRLLIEGGFVDAYLLGTLLGTDPETIEDIVLTDDNIRIVTTEN